MHLYQRTLDCKMLINVEIPHDIYIYIYIYNNETSIKYGTQKHVRQLKIESYTSLFRTKDNSCLQLPFMYVGDDFASSCGVIMMAG